MLTVGRFSHLYTLSDSPSLTGEDSKRQHRIPNRVYSWPCQRAGPMGHFLDHYASFQIDQRPA